MFKRVGDFFGLDIGTRSIRVVQLTDRNNKDGQGSYNLSHFAYLPIDIKIAKSSSEVDRKKLQQALETVIGQSGVKTKNVAVGMPSDKTFATVIDVPMQSDAELAKTIEYQIDQYIPMAKDEAKVDWVSLGQSIRYPEKKEVLLTSVSIEYSETQLEFLENMGLNVIAFEPDQLAMSRSLNIQEEEGVNMIIDLGEMVTDLAIVYRNSPRLVRSIPIGFSSIVRSAVTNLNIKDDQARQFILKFGLTPEKLEGKVLSSIEGVLDNFVSELSKSVKYFETKYPQLKISRIILSGYSAIIPMMNQYVANNVKLPATIGSPLQNIFLSPEQQQVLNVSSELSVAIGLAQRRNII